MFPNSSIWLFQWHVVNWAVVFFLGAVVIFEGAIVLKILYDMYKLFSRLISFCLEKIFLT